MEATQDGQLFEQLKQEVLDVRAQFDTWVAEQRRVMAESKRTHQQSVNEAKENIVNVRREFEQASHKEAAAARVLETERSEVERAQNEASSFQSRQQIIASTKESLQATVDALKMQISDEQQTIASIKQARGASGHEAQKALKFYEQRLGLRIERRKETGAIEFIFSNIDPNRPSSEFSVSILVDSSNQYRLVKLSPFISGVEGAMVQALNQTNDLGAFLKSVRKLFVESVRSF